MKISTLSAALLAAALTAGSAQAAIVTFNYTAVVNQLVYNHIGDLSYPSGGNFWSPGEADRVRVGDIVHGYITYDSEIGREDQLPTGNTENWFGDGGKVAGISANFSHYGNSFDNHPEYHDGSGPDNYSVSAFITNNAPGGAGGDKLRFTGMVNNYRTPATENMEITLGDSTGKALRGGYLPTALSLADFNTRDFRYTAGYYSTLLEARGTITSLTQVSPVPEPGSYAMLLAGLALVGAIARKRGSARQA